MEKIKDGWHTVSGYDVYVEDGYILRGTKPDRNGHEVDAYPYYADKDNGGWTRGTPSVSEFSDGVRSGSWILF